MSHSGNWKRSERKLALEERRARNDEGLPPGWIRIAGCPTPLRTAAACKLRGAVVEGRCRLATECYRRVRIDLDFLITHGFGEVELTRLEPAYRCGRMGGCELAFGEPTQPDGASLFALQLEAAVLSVSFICVRCAAESYRATPSKLIDQIQARGRGDGNTGVQAVARMLRLRCPCGSTEWRHKINRTLPLRT